MTSAPDRREMVALVDEAVAAGARQAAACAELDLDARTFQRWKCPDGGVREDRRPVAERPVPANRLTEAERDRIVATCNTPEFASLPPSQIVPRLADQGEYIASESSFYRVLRERGQNHRRGRARPPRRSQPPTSFKAEAPCQVWSWDITWLPGPVPGMFFYLYLIVDIWSRKIVGWEVHEREGAEFAARLLERAVWAEGCLTSPLALHADNGSAMKGATMKVTMERLRAASSPRPTSSRCWPRERSKSAWMERGPGGTTSSSNASGAPSNTRRSTCGPMPACPRPAKGFADISASTTAAARIHRLTGRPPTKLTSTTRCPRR